MLISVHDKTLSRVTFLDNEKPKTLHYFDDTWHRYLTEATSTFDFSVPKTGNPDLEFLTEKGYISFPYGNKSYLFNIMKVEETEKKLTCYCENLNLELLNETSPEYKAPEARTFAQYIDLLGIQYAQLEIGINEVSDLSRSLEWTGTDTKLARLLSLVNKFDAECEFMTHLNRDGTLGKIVLNVYRKHDDSHQGVGTNRKDVTLYYGKEIKEIRRTIDKTGLYTAIRPIGTDGLTISSISKTESVDGVPMFSTTTGDPHILCPSMRDEYPSQVVDPTGDRYINLDWSYETKNVNTLYGQALAKLKTVYMPAITYEVEGFTELEIGDTIKMHDAGFAPLLLLEARVSEQEISFSKPDRNKTTFANFRALENKLSTDIQSRLEALIQEAVPYKADIITTDGLIFKNSQGSTTLTARVSKGISIVTNQLSIQWYKDGAALSTDESIAVNAADVNEKAVYRFEALNAAGEVKCFAEVTIADVSDGDDGPPGVAGADGRGITGTEITYQASANGTTVPTGAWSSSIPTVSAGQYLWTRVIYTYSDSTISTTYSVSKMGKDGTDGKDGTNGTNGKNGADGKDGQNPIVGELSLNPIPLLASNTGVVSSFADAKGNFRVYDGKTLLTSGVTYSLVSASGVTASINATTGAYTVTAMPQGTDFGTAIFKAAYNGVETQKILSVIKSKQGDTGPRGETGPTGNDGAKGDPTGITVSDTEPTTKYMGMLWKHTGTVSGLVKNATYRWTGTAWELYMFIAKNLQVDNLAAISANLGTITAGTINGVEINGSEFNSDFIVGVSTHTRYNGRMTLTSGRIYIIYDIERNIGATDWTRTGSGQVAYDYSGMSAIERDADGYITSNYSLSPYKVNTDIAAISDKLGSLFTKVVASGRVTVTSTGATWLAIADVPNYSSSNKYFVLANCLTEAIIPYVRSKDGKITAYGPTIRSGSSYTVDYVVIQR